MGFYFALKQNMNLLHQIDILLKRFRPTISTPVGIKWCSEMNWGHTFQNRCMCAPNPTCACECHWIEEVRIWLPNPFTLCSPSSLQSGAKGEFNVLLIARIDTETLGTACALKTAIVAFTSIRDFTMHRSTIRKLLPFVWCTFHVEPKT